MSKKIVIVDDDQAISSIIALELQGRGFETVTVADGYAALEEIQQNGADLVILDVVMPKMDGYQVCRLLKYNDQFSHIPILMFTSQEEEESRRTGGEVGADAYFIKPFDNQQLFAKIDEMLGQSVRR